MKIEKKLRRIIGPVKYREYYQASLSNQNNTIWVLWLQGEENMPLIPKMCLNSIRKNANGRDVILLSLNNLNSYLVLPERILNLYRVGNITAAHLSDIIRVGLLSKYGGFWIDSTMYLTAPIDNKIFSSKLFSLRSEPKGFYVSECRWAGFCLWMNNTSELPHYLNAALLKYWKTEDRLIDYFILDYLIDMACKDIMQINLDMSEIPFNNPNLHELSPLLCDRFDNQLFNQLTENTSLFKLSWKTYSDAKLLEKDTNYYHYLKELAENE